MIYYQAAVTHNLFIVLWIVRDYMSLGLLSYGVFIHWAFSLSTHMITRTEWGLLTPVSGTWSHEQKGDCKPWVLDDPYFLLGLLSLGLFSVPISDHVNRIYCPHLYQVCDHMNRRGLSTLSVRGTLFSGLRLLSVGVFVLGAFVHWGFSLSPQVITWTDWRLSTLSVRGSLVP